MPPWIQTRWPEVGLPRRPVWATALTGLLLAAAMMRGFSAVVGSADSTGALAADVVVQRRAAALAGSALDKALTRRVDPGQVNLDLLLDMARSDLVVVPAPAASSRSALAAGPNPPLAMPLAGALLGTDASLPLPQAPRAQSRRDGALAAAHSGGAGGAEVGMAAAGRGRNDLGGSGGDPEALRAPVRRVVQLLRDNPVWIVGGVVLLLLLGTVVKVFGRRI